jgi:DinB family protein
MQMSTEIEIDVRNGARVDLEGCLVQVEASKAWFHHRVLPLSIEQLRWRPDARHWSIAECLDHLNLTLEVYLPKIDAAIARARHEDAVAVPCSRCEQAEIDALRLVEPPVTAGNPAPSALMPVAAVDPDWLVDQFHETRDRYVDAVHRASGLDLPRIRIVEPIYPVIVSLGGTLAFIAAHDRRHMWQAERVRQAPRFPQSVFSGLRAR